MGSFAIFWYECIDGVYRMSKERPVEWLCRALNKPSMLPILLHPAVWFNLKRSSSNHLWSNLNFKEIDEVKALGLSFVLFKQVTEVSKRHCTGCCELA